MTALKRLKASLQGMKTEARVKRERESFAAYERQLLQKHFNTPAPATVKIEQPKLSRTERRAAMRAQYRQPNRKERRAAEKQMRELKGDSYYIELPERLRPVVTLEDWLKTQPGSTRRGVARGRFQLPAYVRTS